jgi:hypothetical protein
MNAQFTRDVKTRIQYAKLFTRALNMQHTVRNFTRASAYEEFPLNKHSNRGKAFLSRWIWVVLNITYVPAFLPALDLIVQFS